MSRFNINWNAVAGGAPYVTISSFSIAFNSFTASKIDTPERVILGLDDEQLVIAIQPYLGQPGIKSYEFAKREKNGWIRIGCKDFIKYLQSISGIDFSRAKKFVAQYDAEEGFIFIDLHEAENAQT